MKTFYNITGGLIVASAIISGIVLCFTNFFLGLICAASGVVASFPYFTLADLLEKTDILEWKLSNKPGVAPTISSADSAPLSGSVKDALDW